MSNIDFDETVEFVWNWATTLNAYLVQAEWGYQNDNSPVTKRGLSNRNMDDVANHLFKSILKAEDPQRIMKSLSIHLTALTNSSKRPALPREYLEVERKDDNERFIWNLANFCQALDEDVQRTVAKFDAFYQLGEQQVAQLSPKKKM